MRRAIQLGLCCAVASLAASALAAGPVTPPPDARGAAVSPAQVQDETQFVDAQRAKMQADRAAMIRKQRALQLQREVANKAAQRRGEAPQ